MSNDNWKNFIKFIKSKANVEAYYNLVRTVFLQGVERVFNKNKFSNTIDIGCGSGELTKDLLNYSHQVTGVDSSPELINQAQQYGL